MMKLSREKLATAWLFGVMAIPACLVVAGADITVGAGGVWLVLGLVPPGLMLLLWHGASPITVAELFHSVNEPSREGRP